MNRLAAMIALTVLASAGPADAQPSTPSPSAQAALPTPPAQAAALPLALATEAAQTAITTCAMNGYRVTVVVVDAAGAPRLVLAGDGAPGRTVEIGQRKAFTAATLNRPGTEIVEQVRTDESLARRIAADTRMIPWAGARPVRRADGTLIGALGVSGAPGGDKDDACAAAGISRIQDRIG